MPVSLAVGLADRGLVGKKSTSILTPSARALSCCSVAWTFWTGEVWFCGCGEGPSASVGASVDFRVGIFSCLLFNSASRVSVRCCW